MKENRIKEIKDRVASVPKGNWQYLEGDDFDHWQIYSHDYDIAMVQDDSGVPPDENFINFILHAREDLLFLLELHERNMPTKD